MPKGQETYTMATTIKTSYHFRSFPHPALASVPAGVKAATSAQKADFAAHASDFDIIDTAYSVGESTFNVRSCKRKSIDAEICLPDFMASLPDDTVRGLVETCVLKFVKSEFIDEFKPIGQHDWPTVCRVLAERAANKPSGSSIPEVSDADRVVAEAFFVDYLKEVAPKFAPCVVGWISGKCTHARTEKVLGTVTEARTDILARRVAEALELAAVPEVAESEIGAPVKAGLELAAEMLRRFKAVKFAPKDIAGDDEM